MRVVQRGVGMLFLLALVIVPMGLQAQDDDAITVVGSGIVNPVLDIIANESELDVTINSEITGTDAGFEQFCLGEATITTATRPITLDEESSCTTNQVEYDEYLIGHNILTFVTNNEFEALECLETGILNTILAPSASGVINSWNDVGLTGIDGDAPITVYVPPENTALYVMLDELIDGFGLRSDVNVVETSDGILNAVADESFALGVVSQNAVTDAIRSVQFSASPELGCAEPTAENVENQRYVAADRLLVYVNRTATESNTNLTELISYATSEDAANSIASAGFTAPSEDAYAINASIIAGEESGRQFSLEVVAFEIPGNLFGELNIGGAAHASDYINTLTSSFTSDFPSVTPTTSLIGEIEGARRLCNGEIDLIVTRTGLTEEQAEGCNANNIETYTFPLGNQVVVLVANATTSDLHCLTLTEIQSIWASAPEEEAVTALNDIRDSFADTELTLFAPTNQLVIYTDLLLTPADGGAILPLRADTEVDADPLYRAAATANVEGALTYMTWAEYQRVVENNQENIQLVGIDPGDGGECNFPGPQSIENETYPLIRSASLVVSSAALVRPEVQSLLWYAYSDENYDIFEQGSLQGVEFVELPELRASLQEAFSLAQVSQLEVGAEATPDVEVTAEATPDLESTPEAEATPEATAEEE